MTLRTVPSGTIGGWGEELYRGGYFDTVNLSSILSGPNVGDFLLLGAINNTTNEIRLLAASPTSDVTNFTPQTNIDNGQGLFYTATTDNATYQVSWYYNSGSMGFAPYQAFVIQNDTDTTDISLSW